MSQPYRDRAEHASAWLLVRLNRVPLWLPLVAVLAVALGGLLLRGPVAAGLLGVLAAVLAWLGFLSWPRLPLAGRLLRLLAVGLVVLLAVLRYRA
jgi:hypothetical protein